MSIVRPKDLELMEFITELSISKEQKIEGDSKSTKSLTLKMDENDFITNNELTLTVFFKDKESEIPLRTEATTIEWKEGKDLSKKKIKKKQKHKKTGETRTVTKTVSAESVFNCFTTFKCPDMDDSEDEGDEEAAKETELTQEVMQLMEDLHDIHDDALTYYLGFGPSMEEMMANAGYGPEEMEAMMKDGGFGAGGDDDDDDEAIEDEAPKGKKKGKK